MANKRKQKRMLSKFIQVFLTTFALLMIVIAIGTVIYVRVSQKKINEPLSTPDFSDAANKEAQVVDGELVKDALSDKKITTFAVFGVDKDNYRTDVIMLVFFNHETSKIDVIKVNRDNSVKLPDALYEEIQERRSDVTQIVKINEVPAYVAGSERDEASVAVLEKSLGLDIDYYINMDLAVFQSLVNTIGDVTVNIPFDMEYSDPNQDLYISLKAGEQKINGSQAEQLIRYRSGYGNGDIGRIEMQHQFMKAFVKQVLTTKNKVNMINIVGDVILRVNTNFDRAVDYLVYLNDIDPEKIQMYTLPGEAEDSDRSYYVYDYDDTKLLLNNIMNDSDESNEDKLANEEGTEPVIDVVPADIVDVKSLKIQVLNGTNIGKVAGAATKMLEDKGYTMLEADNYTGESVGTKTLIMVHHQDVYDGLKNYFLEPEMVLKPEMKDEETQVIIVLGTTDAKKLKP